jgi:acyl-CoA thioesterase II
VDALSFYGLVATEDPRHWRLPVVPALCSGAGALFGGCGLGAAIEALERTTGRPAVWASGQYLSFARPPSVIDIEIVEAVRGKHVSQARALARVDGEEILTVNAALGRRDSPFSGSWAIRPEVPSPAECPARALFERHQSTIMSRIDMRLARARPMEDFPGAPGDGRAALWVRLPGLELSAAALAIVGDYVPFGIGQALGQRAGGTSLDNTLRIASRVPTEWILADVRVDAVTDGFGHGLVHLWAEDGTLLATASQSTIVRLWRDDGVATAATARADAARAHASGQGAP